MRILIASDTFPPHINGAARFSERLGQGLVRRSHEVHQCAPSTSFRNFTEVVEGMSEACEALGIPVIGGNVWLTHSVPPNSSITQAHLA